MTQRLAIIGIGKFGRHLARELASKGADVLAIDADMDRLDDLKQVVAHTVRLDAREESALRGQGLVDYDAVIVGFGDDFEVTLLTVAALQTIGIQRIIVRATTPTHERILQHLGIKEVVLPSVEAAERLATSLMYAGVLDSFSLSSDATIAEVTAPDGFIGRTVAEVPFRQKHDVSLITIKRIQKRPVLFGLGTKEVEMVIGVPKDETLIERGDVLVVFGSKEAIGRLASA
ncbi:MAG: TrkA family potassium uptake protein [Bacteroidetes bacterium]|jgi:trk system potassium uptake protein TrkA|nr:TrkA family potassium uptake protein [Bacteroidota bacterium]